jgi:hypothetical protein
VNDLVQAKAKPRRAEKVKAAERPTGAKLKYTLYLEPALHDVIRRIAFERRDSIHAVLMEAVDEWLVRQGEPGVKELTKEGNDT